MVHERKQLALWTCLLMAGGPGCYKYTTNETRMKWVAVVVGLTMEATVIYVGGVVANAGAS